MANFAPELIEKAKNTKTTEELLALAKENGVEMTAEEAAAYFAQLHPATGELSDDELDNVAGGGCETSDGQTIVSSELTCFNGQFEVNHGFLYKGTPQEKEVWVRQDNMGLRKLWYYNCSGGTRCGNCCHLEFKGGTGYCGKT